jgi:hypothetical protein
MEISQLTFHPRHTRFTVRFRNRLYSSQVDDIATRLCEMLPTLTDHRCINRHGLPFTEELNDTELGHVFEHVVLELLSQREIYARGQTTWNWERDAIGTYQVTISSGKRIAIKECVLIAQAIFTNLLLGPPLRLKPMEGPRRMPAAKRGSLFEFGGLLPNHPAEAGQLGGEVKLRRH